MKFLNNIFSKFKKNHNKSEKTNRPENDDYKVKSTRKSDIIIAIVSFLSAIVLWLYVIGTTTGNSLL